MGRSWLFASLAIWHPMSFPLPIYSLSLTDSDLSFCSQIQDPLWLPSSVPSSSLRNKLVRTTTPALGRVLLVSSPWQRCCRIGLSLNLSVLYLLTTECILSCLASLVEYLNKWGFIYVGKWWRRLCNNNNVITLLI